MAATHQNSLREQQHSLNDTGHSGEPLAQPTQLLHSSAPLAAPLTTQAEADKVLSLSLNQQA